MKWVLYILLVLLAVLLLLLLAAVIRAALMKRKKGEPSPSALAALALPRSVYPIAAARLCEPIFVPLPETEKGQLSPTARPVLRREAEKSDALLIGCGLGGGEEVRDVVADLLTHASCPVILDADGINAFAGHIDKLKTACPLILTPHPGEMARLMGVTTAEIQNDRMTLSTTTAPVSAARRRAKVMRSF